MALIFFCSLIVSHINAALIEEKIFHKKISIITIDFFIFNDFFL